MDRGEEITSALENMTIEDDDDGDEPLERRLEKYLEEEEHHLTRSAVKKLFQSDMVCVVCRNAIRGRDNQPPKLRDLKRHINSYDCKGGVDRVKQVTISTNTQSPKNQNICVEHSNFHSYSQ